MVLQKNNSKSSTTSAVTRRKRRSPEEILERILVAAGEEFSDMGYNNATTASIARRAEVTEAQLFRYFRSKTDLFRDSIFKPLDNRLSEFNDKFLTVSEEASDIKDKSRRYITELQNFIRENWKMIMSLVVAQAYAPEVMRGVSQVDSLHTYFQRNTEIMTRRLGTNAKVDPKLMVRVSFAAVLANVMFKDWIYPEGIASEEDIRDAIIEFVLNGLNANTVPDTEETSAF